MKLFKKKEIDTTTLLVTRFSAMGDVAMTVPVLHCLATQHPSLRITVLTRKRLTPMFEWLPPNVEVIGVDLDNYKGVAGLERLYSQVSKRRFTAVADLHDVLRTKYLRLRFRVSGAKVEVIDKGRKAKEALIGNGDKAEQLPTTITRYADVFARLGYQLDLTGFTRLFKATPAELRELYSKVGRKLEGARWIGIAPFAAHESKVYPVSRMRQVAETLAAEGMHVFLFGAGSKEREVLESWNSERITSVCGKLSGLREEMLLMSQLDVMLSMDSANMHIAAMVGAPTLSIWGATHPKAGFLAIGQTLDNVIQLPLPCRPCSVYGNKACKFGDMRCMDIAPDTIVNKIKDLVCAE